MRAGKERDCIKRECCSCPCGRWLEAPTAAVVGAAGIAAEAGTGWGSPQRSAGRLVPSAVGTDCKILDQGHTFAAGAAAAVAAAVTGKKV